MSDYKDIDLSFGLNIYDDISKKLDDKAVLQSIKNIVMIRHKLFFPEFGANIDNYLFSVNTPISLNNLRDTIELKLIELEPRLRDLRIIIKEDLNEYQLVVNLYYRIKGSETTYSNVLFLKFLK